MTSSIILNCVIVRFNDGSLLFGCHNFHEQRSQERVSEQMG